MKKKQTEYTDPPSLTRDPFPHCLEMEEAVLGALMIERFTMCRVAHRLNAEMFFVSEHKEIYRAISSLYKKDEPIDLLTVTEEMRKLGTLEKAGGPYRVTYISSRVASSAHLDFHTCIIIQEYIRRELIRMYQSYTRDSMDHTIDVADLIENQRKELEAIEDIVAPETVRTLEEVIDSTLQEAEVRRQNSKNGLTGIPTGLNELNKLTGGLQKGDLIILAGRPAMGKTAVSLCMAWEAAKAGHHVLYCNMEMTAERLMDRLLVGEANIDPLKWKCGLSTPEEVEEVLKVKEQIKHLPVRIDDNPLMSMDYIFSRARQLHREGQCDIIFVDYLQLCQMQPSNKNDVRAVVVGEATRKAKLMARKLGVPVVLLSQLNRNPEGRLDKRPELADLRDSGLIEQDADLVMMVHRPALAGQKEDEGSGFPTKDLGILIISKNRYGPTGDIYFGHNESMTRIGDYSPSIDWIREQLDKDEKIDAKKLRQKYKKS
jgi:replicative DNA helicase